MRSCAPLRDLAPELDTVAMMPTSELSVVNMDPEVPVPYAGEGLLLDGVSRRRRSMRSSRPSSARRSSMSRCATSAALLR